MDNFYRLYLVSGDVEEVDFESFQSALVASGSNFFRFQASAEKAQDGYDSLDDADVEDVTNLSEGYLVGPDELFDPVDNAHVEGSECESGSTVKALFAQSVDIRDDGSFKTDEVTYEQLDTSDVKNATPITSEEVYRVIKLIRDGKIDLS